MPRPTRRAFLVAAGLTAAGATLGCHPSEWPERPGRTPDPDRDWAPEGAPDPDAFPLGVMAGDPTTDGVVLWTRYDGDAALTVTWARWDGAAWIDGDPIDATPADGGFVHVTLTGLPPDTPVAYRFVDASGRASRVGLGRTAPAADVAGVVRLLAVSCCHHKPDHPVLHHGLARGPVDLMCWLGDTVYADGSRTRDDYRRVWERNFRTEGFLAVHAATTHLVGWDDHEVDNNWDPQTIDPELFDTALGAFFEHNPIRRDPEHPGRHWRRVRYGRTVEIFVTDCRGERDGEHYLSPEQMDWLLDGLRTSDARWKLVFSSVPITDMPSVFDIPEVQRDRWEGYPADRARLLDAITDEGIGGVLFLSGDFHMPALARVDPDGPHHRTFEVITGAVGSTTNPLGPLLRESFPEQFPWSERPHTLTRLELHPDGFARVTFVGEEDQTYFDALLDEHGHLLWSEVTEVEDA